MTRTLYWYRWHFKLHDRRLGFRFRLDAGRNVRLFDLWFTHEENIFLV